MFGELDLDVFHVEVVLPRYVFRATCKPLGGFLTYFNDRRRNYLPFENVTIHPLSPMRQLEVIKQAKITVRRTEMVSISVLSEEEMGKIRILDSSREVVFYANQFAFQGALHVNSDTSNDDLLDETRDFYPMKGVKIAPLEKMASSPIRQVPLMLLGRAFVTLYTVKE
ncbi:MAG TPA: hypothetical protein VLL52_11545 [Anaerolineae bacterium]|nr:hypothetical protein [Anaerolineae bacterium]